MEYSTWNTIFPQKIFTYQVNITVSLWSRTSKKCEDIYIYIFCNRHSKHVKKYFFVMCIKLVNSVQKATAYRECLFCSCLHHLPLKRVIWSAINWQKASLQTTYVDNIPTKCIPNTWSILITFCIQCPITSVAIYGFENWKYSCVTIMFYLATVLLQNCVF